MATEAQSSLRLRKKISRDSHNVHPANSDAEDAPEREEVVWGKTPSGEGRQGYLDHLESNFSYRVFIYLFQCSVSPQPTMSSLRSSTRLTQSLTSTSLISGC